MASKKIISVVSSELKTSKQGKQYLDVIDQDGVRYSCWEQGLWELLGKDAVAAIEFEQKGIFKNIVSAERGELPSPKDPIPMAEPVTTTESTPYHQPAPETEPTISPQERGKTGYKADPLKTSSIERQVAIKLACDISSDTETLEQIFSKADKIYKWISGV
jgi:hypothetical protein